MKTIQEVFNALKLIMSHNDTDCADAYVTATDNDGGRRLLRVKDIVYKNPTVVNPKGKYLIVTEDE